MPFEKQSSPWSSNITWICLKLLTSFGNVEATRTNAIHEVGNIQLFVYKHFLRLYKNIFQKKRFQAVIELVVYFYDIFLRVDLTLTVYHELMNIFSWVYVPSLNI